MFPTAVIFDLNGVIIDDMSFHRETWKQYSKNYGKVLSDDDFNCQLSGKTTEAILTYVLNRPVTKEESLELEEEKEEIYRKLFLPHRKPVRGLPEFLAHLKANGVQIALGTSANLE